VRLTGTFWPSLAVVSVAALWGQYWIPTRWLQAHGLGPAWMALATALIVLAATLPFVVSRPATLRTMSVPDLVTGTLMAASFALYNVSLALTTVVAAILMFYLSPLWSSLLGWLLNGQRFTLLQMVAILLALAGLLLTLGFDQGFPFPRKLGDWLSLFAGAMWAYGSLRSQARPGRSFLSNILSFNIGSVATAAGLIVLLPAAARGAVPESGVWTTTLPVLLALALVFVLPTTAALVWATQQLPAPRIGILMMTEVVAGTLSAAIFAGEPFGVRQAAGSLLIIIAGLLEVLGRSLRNRQALEIQA
jgi:drug/metabolite transporter (DMT)-like permease